MFEHIPFAVTVYFYFVRFVSIMDYRDYEVQNSVAITDMRLRTNRCALSSARIYNNVPLFFAEVTETGNSLSSVLKK
jgi:hypothetical protein